MILAKNCKFIIKISTENALTREKKHYKAHRLRNNKNKYRKKKKKKNSITQFQKPKMKKRFWKTKAIIIQVYSLKILNIS